MWTRRSISTCSAWRKDAVRDGLTNVDQLLSRRKRRGKAEAALIAVDPKTGEILALVGGRSCNQSQ